MQHEDMYIPCTFVVVACDAACDAASSPPAAVPVVDPASSPSDNLPTQHMYTLLAMLRGGNG